MKRQFGLIGILMALFSCAQNEKLFQLLPSEKTHIDFNNEIVENDSFNILTEEYIYNGGGVAMGDFNNDSLPDIFFSGNVVSNKLYLNKGDLTFEDVSMEAGIEAKGQWCSGVTTVDINSDGLLDIYVCSTMKKDSLLRPNLLFVNQGVSKEGIPQFKEEAKQYGIDEMGYSTHAAFLDYDHDGDLDLYVLNNILSNKIPNAYREIVSDGSSVNNDQLYQNNGNGTFTNVTLKAGIRFEGYGLGLAIVDVNEDGWPDIYVSNDYLSNDILYINNQDGTFSNRIREYFRHQSLFSMGVDAADINNDGHSELITLDMLSESNLRKKTTISGNSYTNYINNEKWNFQYQHVRNMLHVSNGPHVPFSEMGQLAGVYQTDWSWSPLMADYDNDGYRDILITNGFPKDITDKDFSNYRKDVGAFASNSFLVDSIPVVKISNYAFRNRGDLTFEDVTEKWGLYLPSFSNGAAFADLDLDGDLDYVVNNIDDIAFVYENTLYKKDGEGAKPNHFLRVKLNGTKGNLAGLGAKVVLKFGNGKIQVHHQTLSRGYLSSVEEIVHFGMGAITSIDTMEVSWPDGRKNILFNVRCDQTLTIRHQDASNEKRTGIVLDHTERTLVMEVSTPLNIKVRHRERDKIDFNIQRTLPHKFTQSGPGLAVGDINNDGLEDVVMGGASGFNISILRQLEDGTFHYDSIALSVSEKQVEERGLLLLDSDGDGDLDLYAVSGSIEHQPPTPYYQDQLYINDGRGNFSVSDGLLPQFESSGSCVRAADIDSDGDLDLFVGGRVVPGKYPLPAPSYIFKNEGGRFKDVTHQLCPDLEHAGMVTDALWSDYDNDGKIDLILAGEFMPIVFFNNKSGHFEHQTNTGIESQTGWWNSIVGSDVDLDGDVDYIAGNLGYNNFYHASEKYPLRVYAKDFDGNGSMDAILSCYFKDEKGGMNSFPVHFWDEMNSQSPKFRRQFSRYRQYGKTTMELLFSKKDLQGALVLSASTMATCFIENLGQGRFNMKALPVLAQVAPVNGMLVDDVNHDTYPDVMMVGNDYGNEVFSGRYDAFTGLVLLGNGKGDFNTVPISKSGFQVFGDAKALVKLYGSKGDEVYIASQNRDSLKVFAQSMPHAGKVFTPSPLDAWALFVFKDGKKQRMEFYHGSGYLSQSTRKVRIPLGVVEIRVVDVKGKERVIKIE